MAVSGLDAQRFTRSVGFMADMAATPAEVLRFLRTLRRRHAAVTKLISALEECKAAGCDLRYVRCLGCDRAPRASAAPWPARTRETQLRAA